MKIKKFVGQSFKEALEIVKKELGPDAIILSSKSVKTGPFGLSNKEAVEVTAAIDETESIPEPKNMSSDLELILKEIRSLRDEVGFLKETFRPIMPALRIGKDKKGLFNLLSKQGVDSQFAMILLERSHDTLDSLKNAIKQDIRIQGLLPIEEKGLIFFGQPGVGKTTSMSKVAHMIASKNRNLTMVSLDSERIGSLAYMKDISNQLRCQLKVVRKISDLPKVVYREMQRGPILIDTPGYEYNTILEDMNDIFPNGFPLKKCFLMDASMNTDSALKAWQGCRKESIDYIGFTKLDMASQYGNLYNLSLLTSRPLSFITTGPGVPDDIRVPSPDFLAGLITGGV